MYKLWPIFAIYKNSMMISLWDKIKTKKLSPPGEATRNTINISYSDIFQYNITTHIISYLSQSKAYLMVSNFLTLESWKVRSLRLELESLTNFGLFFTFDGKNQNYCYFFNMNRKMRSNWPMKLVKFDIPICILSFWKKLESWLDRLNTPLKPIHRSKHSGVVCG